MATKMKRTMPKGMKKAEKARGLRGPREDMVRGVDAMAGWCGIWGGQGGGRGVIGWCWGWDKGVRKT